MVPKLRFKEFCGEWEEKKIKDFSKCYAGATPSTKINEYWENGNIPWMNSGEVNKARIKSTENFITELGFKKSSTKIVPPKTVIMALAGQGKTRGMVAITEIELCTNQSLAAIVTNDCVDDEYLYQYLKKEYTNLRLVSSGDGSRGGLNLKLINDYKIKLPELPEQTKIADFLSTVDDKIQNQQDKITHLENIKKGFMQRIFSRKIRFKDDGGDEFPEWEDIKLGDKLIIHRGASPRPIEKYLTYDKNGLNWIKIGDVSPKTNVITKTQQKIIPEGLTKTRQVFVGDLILSNSMSFGRPYIMGINGCIHDGWLLIRDYDKNFNLKYLCYLLSSTNVLNQYKKLSAGSTVKNLNSELVKSVKIEVPCIKEQQKIADFLSSFDEKISTERETLEHLKQLKKGLLQQMFV